MGRYGGKSDRWTMKKVGKVMFNCLPNKSLSNPTGTSYSSDLRLMFTKIAGDFLYSVN